MSEFDEHLEIDKKKIENSIKLHLPVELTTYTLPRNMEAYIQSVEEVFLQVCHQEHLKEYINFCLGELLTNSKKANTKRVYFKEKNLDINDPADYAVGMEHFKEDTIDNLDYYLELQKKEGYYIKFSMQLKKDQIILEIKNNAILTSFENDRIQNKLKMAQQYSNMDEVIANVIDQSEGAGLGIIIIILMLQKVGLSKDNYQVFCTDTDTVTRIILPCNEKIFAGVEIISYEFINLQSKLPILKDNYDELSKIIQADFVDRNSLLTLLRKDITLSLLILKYAIEKDPKCFNLTKALEMLSDQDLKFILSDSNPSSDFIDSTDEIKKIWNHAYKTAFFTYNLAKNAEGFTSEFDEEGIYLLGLLNSICTVLVNTASQEQKDCIVDLSKQYEGISEKIQDVFNLGNAGNYLSLIYAKKFGFSDSVASILGRWNLFDSLSDDNRKTASLLYLAELMQYYSEGAIEYYQIDKNILAENKINNEAEFKYIISHLNSQID